MEEVFQTAAFCSVLWPPELLCNRWCFPWYLLNEKIMKIFRSNTLTERTLPFFLLSFLAVLFFLISNQYFDTIMSYFPLFIRNNYKWGEQQRKYRIIWSKLELEIIIIFRFGKIIYLQSLFFLPTLFWLFDIFNTYLALNRT